MLCKIDELKDKQVVCVKDGSVLGYIADIELDTQNGKLTAIIIPGRLKFFGLLGHEEDIIVPWDEIEVIGEETVLVKTEVPFFLHEGTRKRN